MSDHEDKEPETPRDGHPSGTRALSDATRSVADAGVAVDGLVVVVREGMRRAMLMILGCGALLAVSTLTMLFTYLRVHAQTARLETLAAKLEQIATSQAETKRTAEETREKVDDAKAALDERPTVELVPSPTAGSGRPSAVVRIKPAAKPKAPDGGQAPPQGPAIELPVKLPPDAKVQQPPADGGTERK